MSVPKPRIWQTASRYLVPASERLTAYWMPPMWRWSCECGAGWTGMHAFSEIVNAATQHSKRHMAERVAENLEQWAVSSEGDRRNVPVGSSLALYWQGRSEAEMDAARLVRQYLVKTP